MRDEEGQAEAFQRILIISRHIGSLWASVLLILCDPLGHYSVTVLIIHYESSYTKGPMTGSFFTPFSLFSSVNI